MRVMDLTERIEKEIPREQALDWDNVGLLVGDKEQEIHKVYVALDLTDAVLEHAIDCGADMILTHHPLIFGGIKRVNADDFIGRRILALAQHGIAYYAMHTNFDVCVMGQIAAEQLGLMDIEALEVTSPEDGRGIGCRGKLTQAVSLYDLAERVRDAFGLSHVKVFGDKDRMVQSIAMCPGSGKSEIGLAIEKGADAYITGDIDHHSGIDAVADGLSIIDAGHYGIEHIYMEYMKNWLAKEAAELEVVTEPFAEPFWIVTR